MKLINNDCIAAMREMPDDSVDSIVTDPPYELGFMGKSWDASGIAFNIEVWQEALRVLKPGGHLIAFSGSRTYHRMAVAIEDAGFQIRDQIMWVYGSGFPKSHNISKGIDKASDFEGEVIGTEKIDIGIQGGSMHAGRQTNVVEREVVELSPDAAKWQGWGTALKPAHEPMVLARKPVVGTVANNVLTYGVGGLNIDGSRVGTDGGSKGGSRPSTHLSPSGAFNTGHDIDKLDAGRFPANFIHDGSDEVVALFPDTRARGNKNSKDNGKEYNATSYEFGGFESGWAGDSGSAARFFYCAKASKRDRNEGLDGFEVKETQGGGGRPLAKYGEDEESQRLKNAASAFGAVKAARANTHPTVKPTSLMQYLVRLVTPPNGVVLDPFMGSGSTGKACAYEGFDFIGIEQSAEYVEIAQARIDFALQDKETELPL
jgi:site-specific DNA-methyltransferase (adenine-specific)